MEPEILLDMEECADRMVRLFQGATRCVYYSAFVCQMDADLPGHPGVTMNRLTTEAADRGVQVNMIFNPSLQYGNEPFEGLDIHPSVNIATISGNGIIPEPFSYVFGETYTNHHQKFLLVDDEYFMVGGVGVHPCRAGWMVLNSESPPYYWHEVGVVVECNHQISEWVRAIWGNQFMPLPSPLISGDSEHLTTLKLIDTAKTCVHMEAQLCISTDTTTNQVLQTVVDRLIRASRTPGDRFRFMLLVNTHQPDEHPVVSSVTTGCLHWSKRVMMSRSQEAGLSPLFFRERVFIGTLEHNGTHIKVHSNLLIQDGHTMIRTSSNLTDRSLSDNPCDNELGVVVHGMAVARAQQTLWKRYFMMDGPDMYPHDAFRHMVNETGVVRATQTDYVLPYTLVNTLMRTLHSLPFFGGKHRVVWETNLL